MSCSGEEEVGETGRELPVLFPDWWGGGQLGRWLNCLKYVFFFFCYLSMVHFWCFWQPIGALLLEQCRVEKEDGQSFSVGELQHPGFPLLVYCALHYKRQRFRLSIFCWLYCLQEILCFCSKHFWTKQRGNICLNVTLRSSVWSGWMPLSRPGSTFSLPFDKKESIFRCAWCTLSVSGTPFWCNMLYLYIIITVTSSWGKNWFSIGLKSTGSPARWGWFW